MLLVITWLDVFLRFMIDAAAPDRFPDQAHGSVLALSQVMCLRVLPTLAT